MSEPEKTLDLSSFEGHTPVPWACEEPEDDEEPFRILYGSRLHGMDGNGYAGRCLAKHDDVEVGEGLCPCDDRCGECQDCLDFAEVRANARLMADAPKLLAEVERLYAERDTWRETLLDVRRLVWAAAKHADGDPKLWVALRPFVGGYGA